MKIKLLRDIPGYKAGEIYEGKGPLNHGNSWYVLADLIVSCFAEEIKDDIDIEAIRKQKEILKNPHWDILFPELEWFSAYRIVKAVIDQLNMDSNHSVESFRTVVIAWYGNDFHARDRGNKMYTYQTLPKLGCKTCAEKVIELCEPELKVLFGVK